MKRIEYNKLLLDAGIYEKRKLEKEEPFDPNSDVMYRDATYDASYEIIPSDLTTEEMKVFLLAKQTSYLKQLNNQLIYLLIIVIISFLLGLTGLFH